MADLRTMKVAVLIDNYPEQPEYTDPIQILRDAGVAVETIAASAKDGQIQGMQHAELGDKFTVDKTLEEANIADYDALLLPGGGINADALRMNEKAREWVQKIVADGKPLAAICHAPWVLTSAGVAKGRKLTSYFTIQDDMRAAGADWVDQEVVVDGSIITSRKPDDIPAFTEALLSQLRAI